MSTALTCFVELLGHDGIRLSSSQCYGTDMPFVELLGHDGIICPVVLQIMYSARDIL